MSTDAVAGLSTLDDPIRRRLYDYVASRDEPVSREDAAAAAGIGRPLAAYHLDKLAEAGILTVTYARSDGRGGPGAGRPAKRYARTSDELSVTVPPRNYALLGRLLADAVAADTSGTVRASVDAAARRAGRDAALGKDVMSALRACGYEPAALEDGGVELRNCPFHQLSRRHTELVCGLNLVLIQGMFEELGERPERVMLAPRAGRCCVVVRGAPASPKRSR